MAITYANLFGDLGQYIKATNKFIDLAKSAGIADPDFDALLAAIRAQLDTSGLPELTEGLETMFDGFRSGASSNASTISNEATKRLLDRDTVINELPGAFEGDIGRVLQELYRDMVANSQTINSSAVTINPAVADVSNVGNGTVYTISTLDGVTSPSPGMPPFLYYRGQESQLAVPSETMSLTCIADEDTSGTPEGQEIFLVEGQPATNGTFGWKTEGSGVNVQMATAQAASLVLNQNMEAWSNNIPVNWFSEAGAAGVEIMQETQATDVFRGNYALKLAGTGIDSRLVQEVPVGTLEPNRGYFFAAYIKSLGVTAGSLNIELESPTGGYTAGGTEKIALATGPLAALATYTAQTFFFLLPANLPDDLRWVIRHEGTPDGEVWIDSFALTPVVYANGIGMAVLAGGTQFTLGDRFTLDVSNTEGVFQQFFRRKYRRQLPNSGTPSIADALAQ